MEATGNFVFASQCFTISTEKEKTTRQEHSKVSELSTKTRKAPVQSTHFLQLDEQQSAKHLSKKKKRKKTRASTCTVPNCFRHLRTQMQTSPEFAGSQSKGSACEVYCGNDHGERKRKESDCDGWLTPLRGSASAASTSSPPRLPGVAQHKTGSQRI